MHTRTHTDVRRNWAPASLVDYTLARNAQVCLFRQTHYHFLVVKPGTRQHAPGFLKLFLCRCLCMFVCVSAPEAINNRLHDMDSI